MSPTVSLAVAAAPGGTCAADGDVEAVVRSLRSQLTCSVPEAGALLGIGRDAAYAAAERGEIPVLRLGRTLRVPVPKLLELVGLTPAAPAAPTTEPADSPQQLLSKERAS